MLKELSEACRKYGLKFGVYISPWDRNHPLYGTPEYNRAYKEQWHEVLTGYGEVFEAWLDGANDQKKRMVYDFNSFFWINRRGAAFGIGHEIFDEFYGKERARVLIIVFAFNLAFCFIWFLASHSIR